MKLHKLPNDHKTQDLKNQEILDIISPINIVHIYIYTQKKKTRRYQENPEGGWRQSLAPSLLSRNKILVIAAKNYAKLDLKVFCSCPVLLDSLLCPINFPRLWFQTPGLASGGFRYFLSGFSWFQFVPRFSKYT